MIAKLNLGCGNRPTPGAVNHDRVKHRDEVDVVHDLNILPWPWPDNSFDLITAVSVFEHLEPNLVETVNECWRLMRTDGLLYMKVPYWQSEVSWWDPTHRWRYAPHSFDIFDPTTGYGAQYAFYTERKWKIVKPAELNHGHSSIHITLRVIK